MKNIEGKRSRCEKTFRLFKFGAAVAISAMLVTGCENMKPPRGDVAQLKRHQRYEIYRECFNKLYDPMNPYHNMTGMQRACSRFAKARVP